MHNRIRDKHSQSKLKTKPMDKKQLKQALISILVGAAIMALNAILTGLLELVKSHQEQLIPSVTGMVYFFRTWKPIA